MGFPWAPVRAPRSVWLSQSRARPRVPARCAPALRVSPRPRHPALSSDPTVHSAGHCCWVSCWCHRWSGRPCDRLLGSWWGGGCSGGLRMRSVGMCLASSDYAGWWAWGGSPHGGCALLARHTQGAHHPRGCQPRCVCWVSGRTLLFSSFRARLIRNECKPHPLAFSVF